MKNIVLFPALKAEYGPMAGSIIQTGVEVASFNKDLTGYDKVVLFCNDPTVITDMRAEGRKVGWWMCDYRNPETQPHVPVDKVFLCNTQYLKLYEQHHAPTFYVPQCGIDTFYPSEERIEWDVLFIGNFSTVWHTNRQPIIDAISGQFKTKIISGQFYTRTQKYLYKNTPISLAMSPQGKGYTSNRLYNILSSGGFCLTLWFPGIENLFENHKHLVWFKTKEEAVEIIKYYLEHKDERDRIAADGLKEYQLNHTAAKRLETMFNLL